MHWTMSFNGNGTKVRNGREWEINGEQKLMGINGNGRSDLFMEVSCIGLWVNGKERGNGSKGWEKVESVSRKFTENRSKRNKHTHTHTHIHTIYTQLTEYSQIMSRLKIHGINHNKILNLTTGLQAWNLSSRNTRKNNVSHTTTKYYYLLPSYGLK